MRRLPQDLLVQRRKTAASYTVYVVPTRKRRENKGFAVGPGVMPGCQVVSEPGGGMNLGRCGKVDKAIAIGPSASTTATKAAQRGTTRTVARERGRRGKVVRARASWQWSRRHTMIEVRRNMRRGRSVPSAHNMPYVPYVPCPGDPGSSAGARQSGSRLWGSRPAVTGRRADR